MEPLHATLLATTCLTLFCALCVLGVLTHMVLRLPHGAVQDRAQAPRKGADGPRCNYAAPQRACELVPLGLLDMQWRSWVCLCSLELQEGAVRHLS